MPVTYNKLWKLLIDRKLTKKKLAELSGISQFTMTRLSKGETVTTETLEKICKVLGVDIGDICEIETESKL